MTELFEPPSNEKRIVQDQPAERGPRNVAVFVFFYLAFSAGLYFAIRWLLPPDAAPWYAIILIVLYATYWLFNKFQQRN